MCKITLFLVSQPNSLCVFLGLEDEPAPTAYNAGVCKDRIMNKPSSYTIPRGRKRGTVLWSKRGKSLFGTYPCVLTIDMSF